MSQNPDFSEGFYRSHAQRYAEVSHGFVQSIYLKASHPGLKGDTDLMDRLQELLPCRLPGAGCRLRGRRPRRLLLLAEGLRRLWG